ncbi:MAG: GC-type dockerin domain-anchored protein [Planctomycetota bacterium]
MPSSLTTEVRLGLAGPYVVTSSSFVLHDTLTISNPQASLVLDGVRHSIYGDARNQGSITIRSDGELSFQNDAVIEGSGTIRLETGNPLQPAAITALSSQVTHASGHTVRGAGEVAASSTGFINNGVIIADDPAHPLVLRGDFSGSGVFGANGATLLLDAATMTGARLNSQNGGAVVVGEGVATLDGGRNDGMIELDSAARLLIEGVYTNDGTVSVFAFDPINGDLISLRDGASVDGTGLFDFQDFLGGGGIKASGGVPATIGSGQTIRGEFTLDGDLVIDGTLDPDGLPSDIEGDVVLGPSSVTRITIDQTSADDIDVDGTLTLGGTLVIEFADGYVPTSSRNVIFIDGEPGVELLGDFDAVEVPIEPVGWTYTVELVFGGVRVLIDPPPPCPADTNGDGLLTPADFNAWVLAFNTQAPECDQNGDGICAPADFNAWVLNFNSGC